MTKIALIDSTTVHNVWDIPNNQTEVVTRFTLPNGDQLSPISLGWSNNVYSIVLVTEFEVPEGKQIISSPNYAIVDGVVVETYDVDDIPPLPLPDRVTSRQFKLALLAHGLLDDVEAWIGAQDRVVQVAFENSSTFVRDEPMMQAGFAALGFTEGQIDAFFTAASEL